MEMVEIHHPDLDVTLKVDERKAKWMCADPPAGGGWKIRRARKKPQTNEGEPDGES